MPAIPLALTASAPVPEDFRNLRRVTRAILFLPGTHAVCQQDLFGKCRLRHRAGQARAGKGYATYRCACRKLHAGARDEIRRAVTCNDRLPKTTCTGRAVR